MASFFSRIFLDCFCFFEQIISELFSLFALIDMMINERTQIEVNQLHQIADQTEKVLQTALDTSFNRNEQLNMLLDRTDILLHQNQALGVGLMDYRKEIERKQMIARLKYIAIGILLILIVILVIVLTTVVDRTNHLTRRTRNVIFV